MSIEQYFRYMLQTEQVNCHQVVLGRPRQVYEEHFKSYQSSLIPREQYGKDGHHALKFPKLPTLRVGSLSRNTYIPMEMTRIRKQGAPITKKLNERETLDMIRNTAVAPGSL